MQIFSQAEVIELLDSMACALLAAAATCRARNLGAHFSGAMVLGCLAALSGPLLRELILHGQNGPAMVINLLPDDAIIGALGAILALFILKSRSRGLFTLLDSLGIGLTGALACILSLRELGIVGAVTLGFVCSLAPGLIRDCALGDTAMLVDESWYAASAIIGCVAAPGFLILFDYSGFVSGRVGEASVICAALIVAGIRYFKGKFQNSLN